MNNVNMNMNFSDRHGMFFCNEIQNDIITTNDNTHLCILFTIKNTLPNVLKINDYYLKFLHNGIIYFLYLLYSLCILIKYCNQFRLLTI